MDTRQRGKELGKPADLTRKQADKEAEEPGREITHKRANNVKTCSWMKRHG